MESGGVQIRVSDMLFALQKRWKMILSLTVVGFVFGVVLFAMTYVQDSIRSYEVSGSFAISTQNHSEGVYTNGSQVANNNDFHLAEDMVDSVVYVLRSNSVLSQVIAQQGLLGTTVDELRSNLSINQYQATQIIEMHFTWRTEEEAESIWQAIVTEANQIIPQALQLGQLAIINPPEVVKSTAAGSGKILPILLTMLGFCCGIGIAVMELIIRPTLTNPRDAETLFGLENIGIIPRDELYFRSRQGSILTSSGPDRSNVLQNYAAAAYILRNRLGTKEQHHCFYVTSTTAGEGKSTVAANLAIQLSDMEHRTLLIDFDIRNPSLGTLFMDKVDYAHSLNALYRGDATEEDAITPLTGYLDLLPAVLEHNAIMLDGAVTDLIQRLSEKYEYIIMDSAPVGEVSETLSLNRVATTVLFVIEYDSTPLPAIQNSLEKLDKSGIRVLGCVVNGVGAAGSSRTGETRRRRKAAPVQPKRKKQPKPEKPKKQKKALKPKVEKPRNAEKSAQAEPVAPRTAGWSLWKPKKARPQPKHGKHAKGAPRVEEPLVEKVPAGESAAENRPAEGLPVQNVQMPETPAPVMPTKKAPTGPAPMEVLGLRPGMENGQRRDVLSELMAEEKPLSDEERSTQSVMDELLRLSSESRKSDS